MSFATSPVHGRNGQPVRVLIADDHPVVRQGLKMMLSNDPEVDVVGEARDGDEAFDMAHKVDWDVAVLDYSMPGRGGVELLSDVKHDYPDKPVLIMSIYPEDPHGLRARGGARPRRSRSRRGRRQQAVGGDSGPDRLRARWGASADGRPVPAGRSRGAAAARDLGCRAGDPGLGAPPIW